MYFNDNNKSLIIALVKQVYVIIKLLFKYLKLKEIKYLIMHDNIHYQAFVKAERLKATIQEAVINTKSK